MTRRRDVKSLAKTIECKCPKCGVMHEAAVFYTGRGIMRKYCPNCDLIITRVYGCVEEYQAPSLPGLNIQ